MGPPSGDKKRAQIRDNNEMLARLTGKNVDGEGDGSLACVSVSGHWRCVGRYFEGAAAALGAPGMIIRERRAAS